MEQLLGGFLIFGIFLLIFAIVAYFLSAIALSKIASNRGIANSWLAFIPIANLYLQGLIIKEFDVFNFKIEKPEFVLPIVAILPLVLVEAGAIGSIVSLLCIIVSFFAMYRLYFILDKDTAQRNILLSIFLPITAPFILYSLRNK